MVIIYKMLLLFNIVKIVSRETLFLYILFLHNIMFHVKHYFTKYSTISVKHSYYIKLFKIELISVNTELISSFVLK